MAKIFAFQTRQVRKHGEKAWRPKLMADHSGSVVAIGNHPADTGWNNGNYLPHFRPVVKHADSFEFGLNGELK